MKNTNRFILNQKCCELFVSRTEYFYRQYAIVFDRNSWVEKPSLVKALYSILSVLSGENDKWGIMLAGGVGTGKTTLLKSCQRFFCVMSDCGFLPDGTGIRMKTAKDISELVVMSAQMHYAYFNEPLLAIDDLGNEATEILSYGTVKSPICDLLEYRYSRHLLTFVSTNLSSKERVEKYGNRIADRFEQMFLKIVFNEDSYRRIWQ